MKKIIYILFLFPTLIFSQTENYFGMVDTASMLTGTWLRIKLEAKGQITEQKIINGEYWKLIRESEITIDSVKLDGFYVIELSFDKIGHGEYQEYYNFKTIQDDNDNIEISTCQPVPELIWRDGKIAIFMTFMNGEDVAEIIELTESKLIILYSDGVKQSFIKLK